MVLYGKSSKMFAFYKNKIFLKFTILLGVLSGLYVFLLFFENLSSNNLKNPVNREFFSLLNKDFDNFFEIKKINLLGRSKTNINSIENIVFSSLKNNKNIIKNDFKKMKTSLEELKWIKTVSIKKNFPDSITIKIEEHDPFAILTNHKKNYLISDKGKIIYEISSPHAYELIKLEGNLVLEKLNDVKEFINQYPNFKRQINKVIIQNNGRWDLVTKEGILFKLPIRNKQAAIDEINKYISLKNIEVVDLRFLNKKIFMKTKQGKEIVMRQKEK